MALARSMQISPIWILNLDKIMLIIKPASQNKSKRPKNNKLRFNARIIINITKNKEQLWKSQSK